MTTKELLETQLRHIEEGLRVLRIRRDEYEASIKMQEAKAEKLRAQLKVNENEN